ncbi:MAG: four helix bundle protein [Elusimicrobiota bacterium]
MNNTQNSKKYDLGPRTLRFAGNAIAYVKELPKTLTNNEISKQLARSACSVGANFIEAEERLSRKDFVMRIKICRKEAKETRYWLALSDPLQEQEFKKQELYQEALELTKIFGSIVEKCR